MLLRIRSMLFAHMWQLNKITTKKRPQNPLSDLTENQLRQHTQKNIFLSSCNWLSCNPSTGSPSPEPVQPPTPPPSSQQLSWLVPLEFISQRFLVHFALFRYIISIKYYTVAFVTNETLPSSDSSSATHDIFHFPD